MDASERRRLRHTLEQLLNLRRDKRYRMGAIQLAALFDLISNQEFDMLESEVRKGCKVLKIA